MNLNEIVNGAALANAARNFGMSKDELVDFAIRTSTKEGADVASILQKMVDSDLDMQREQLASLGLDKYEDVLRESEEADNRNFVTRFNQNEIQQGYDEGKEDKRLRQAAENIEAEARYRGGNYDEESQEFKERRQYSSEQRFPEKYDPEQDDFVVKKKGRIIKFKKHGKQNYKPTRNPDGIIKRRMAKYYPGQTFTRFDPATGAEKVHNTPPEPFYPGARLSEPFDRNGISIGGKSDYAQQYNQLVAYINSGSITDPRQLAEAEDLKRRMKLDLEPGYAKAQDFDRGAAVVRQDRVGLSQDRIDALTTSDLRELTANGSQVRPTDAGPFIGPMQSVSNQEVAAMRQASILKSIHNPTEVEPARGRRNIPDIISQEAQLRAYYGSRPSRERQLFNDNIALRDAVINDTDAAKFSDERLGTIGEIKIAGRGYKKNGKPDWIGEAPISYEDPSSFPDAYRQYGPISQDTWDGGLVYFDGPQGNPLAVQGLDIKPDVSINAPNSGQNNNSPDTRPVMRDMEDVIIANQFATRPSGIYPQADISGALTVFNDRVGRLNSIAPELRGNAGTLQDVQNAVDVVLGLAAEQGKRLNTFGTKEKSSDPGPMEVLGKMRYTTPEVTQLSNALLQLELGRTSGVNSLAKSEFFSGAGPYMANAPIGLGSKGTGRTADLNAQGPAISLGRDRIAFGEVEQMSDYSIGDNLERANQRVAPAFRGLTGQNIEGTPRERSEALEDAKRPYIGQIRGEIVPIDGKRGNPNYRFNATGQTDPVKIGEAIAEQARMRASKKNPRNLDREAANAFNAQSVTARHYPDSVKLARAGEGGRRRNQSSLKRNEYDLFESRSNQTDPYTEQPATGGGLTTYSPTSSKSSSSYSNNSGKRSDDSEFRARVRKRLEVGQRARAGAAIAGGVGAAVAGINGLIGGERDKREEAQY